MTRQVYKRLSPNDMGETDSHQAGIHVPKALTEFFPDLDESVLNPRTALRLINEKDEVGICSYIHYNNKLIEGRTRDEYRITRIRPFLVACGAQTGDVIEFVRVADSRYRIRVLSSNSIPDGTTVVVDLARGWTSVRI